MMRFSRRTWLLLGVLAVAALAAVGGYAYFTAPGSGTGNAVVGSTQPIAITSTTPSGLWPDGANHAITVVLQNTGDGPQYVGTVTGAVQDFPGCSGSWFQVDPIPVGGTIPVGNTGVSTNIRMVDNGGDQSGCAGGTLTIVWAS